MLRFNQFSFFIKNTAIMSSTSSMMSSFLATSSSSATSSTTNWDHLMNELNSAGKSKHYQTFNETLKMIEEDLSRTISTSTTDFESSPPLALCPLSPSNVADYFGAISQLVHVRLSWNNINFLLWALCCTCDQMSSKEASMVLQSLQARGDMFHDSAAVTLCEVIAKDLNSRNHDKRQEEEEGNNTSENNQNDSTVKVMTLADTRNRADELCNLLMFVAQFQLHKTPDFLPPQILEDACSELARLASSSSSSLSILPVQTRFFLHRLSVSNLPHAPLIPLIQKALLQSIPKEENISMLNVILRYHLKHGEVTRAGSAFLPSIMRVSIQRFEQLVFDEQKQQLVLTSSAIREGSNFISSIHELVSNYTRDCPPAEAESLKNILRSLFIKFDDWVLKCVWGDVLRILNDSKIDSSSADQDDHHDEPSLSSSSYSSLSTDESKLLKKYFSSCRSVTNLDIRSLLDASQILGQLLDQSVIDPAKQPWTKREDNNNNNNSNNNDTNDNTFDEDGEEKNGNLIEEEPEEARTPSLSRIEDNRDQEFGDSSSSSSDKQIVKHHKLLSCLYLLAAMTMIRCGESPHLFTRQKQNKFHFKKLARHKLKPFGILKIGSRNENHDDRLFVLSSGALTRLKGESESIRQHTTSNEGDEENNSNNNNKLAIELEQASFFAQELIKTFEAISSDKSSNSSGVVETFRDARTDRTSVLFRKFCEECLTPSY